MEDRNNILRFLDEVVGELDPNKSVTERAAIFGGATALLNQLEKHVDEDYGGDAYAHEKISKARWSLAAALSIDEGKGHTAENHRVWMYGALGSLQDRLAYIDKNQH